MAAVDLFLTSKQIVSNIPQVGANSVIKFQQNYIFLFDYSDPSKINVVDTKNNLEGSIQIGGDEVSAVEARTVDELVLLIVLTKQGKFSVYAVYSESSIKLALVYSFYDQTVAFNKLFFPHNKKTFIGVSGRSVYLWDLSSYLPSKESLSSYVAGQEIHSSADPDFATVAKHIHTFRLPQDAQSSPVPSTPRSGAFIRSTPIITVGFHTDNVHILVLLNNNSLHCLNTETRKYIFLTFFLPSESVSPFPGILSPNSSIKPFTPQYISIFTHPTESSSVYVLLFDDHFDTVGYTLSDYSVKEGEKDRKGKSADADGEVESASESGPLVLLDLADEYEFLSKAKHGARRRQGGDEFGDSSDDSESQPAADQAEASQQQTKPIFHNKVTDFIFDPIARLWIVHHVVQPPEPDYNNIVPENTPFSKLKHPAHVVSLFHIPASLSTATKVTEKSTFKPVHIFNAVLLETRGIPETASDLFDNFAITPAYSSSSSSSSFAAPTPLSLNLPSVLEAPATQRLAGSGSARLFPYSPFPFAPLFLASFVRPENSVPSLIAAIGALALHSPERAVTTAAAAAAAAVDEEDEEAAVAKALEPIKLTEDGGTLADREKAAVGLATVLNKLLVRELISLATGLATESQSAAVGHAEVVYDLETYRRLNGDVKEGNAGTGAAAPAGQQKIETQLKTVGVDIYGLIDKRVHSYGTQLVLVHYFDEEAERKRLAREKKKKAVQDEEESRTLEELLQQAEAAGRGDDGGVVRNRDFPNNQQVADLEKQLEQLRKEKAQADEKARAAERAQAAGKAQGAERAQGDDAVDPSQVQDLYGLLEGNEISLNEEKRKNRDLEAQLGEGKKELERVKGGADYQGSGGQEDEDVHDALKSIRKLTQDLKNAEKAQQEQANETARFERDLEEAKKMTEKLEKDLEIAQREKAERASASPSPYKDRSFSAGPSGDQDSAQVREENARLKKELDEALRDAPSAVKDSAQQREEIAKLKKELDEAKRDAPSGDKDSAQQREEIAKLKKELDEAKRDAPSGDSAQLKEENAKLKKELDEAQRDAPIAKRESEQLKEENAKLNEELNEAKREAPIAKRESAQLKEENAKLKEELEEAKRSAESAAQLKEENANLKDENKNLKEENTNQKEENTNLKKEVDEAKRDGATAKKQLELVKQEAVEAVRAKNEAEMAQLEKDAKLEALEEEVQKLRDEDANRRKEEDKKNEKEQKLKSRIKDLKKKKKEKSANLKVQNKSLLEEIDQLDQDYLDKLEFAQAELERLEKEKKDLDQKIDDMQVELENRDRQHRDELAATTEQKDRELRASQRMVRKKNNLGDDEDPEPNDGTMEGKAKTLKKEFNTVIRNYLEEFEASQRDLEELEKQNADLREEIRGLNAKLDQAEHLKKENEKLKATLSEDEQQREEDERQRKDIKREVEKLRSENNDLKDTLDRQTVKAADDESAKKALKKENDALKKEISSLKDTLNEKEQSVAQKEVLERALKRENEESRKKLVQLENSIESQLEVVALREDNEARAEEIKRLQADIEDLKEKLGGGDKGEENNLKKQVEDLTEELGEYKEGLEELKKENEDLKAEKEKEKRNKEGLEDLKRENEDLKAEKEKLARDLKKAQQAGGDPEKEQKLEKEVKQLKEDKDRLEREKKKLEKKVDDLESKPQVKSRDFGGNNDDDDDEKRENELKKEKERLQREHQELTEKLRTQEAELRAENKKLRKELEDEKKKGGNEDGGGDGSGKDLEPGSLEETIFRLRTIIKRQNTLTREQEKEKIRVEKENQELKKRLIILTS